jgi:hypothetical protein
MFGTTMAGSHALIGVILLLFGRRLFWLFVGAAGFVAGLTFARELAFPQAQWTVLLVAIVAGLIGAVVSVFLQQIAIAVAGFLLGGYVATSLFLSAGQTTSGSLLYVIGGVVGALLVVTLFDYALIVLSSLAGATLLAQAIGREQAVSVLVFVVALVVGLAAQLAQLRSAPPV